MFKAIGSCALAILLAANTAQAATVTYSLTDRGGQDFTADFTVTNDTLGAPIEEITIYFTVGEFENLFVAASPADWDGIEIQPEPNIPDDGFADWLATGAPLGVDETLSGFSVDFSYLGMGLPGDLFFEIVDPNTFDVLEFGFATRVDVNPVPIPAAFWLFGAAVVAWRRTQLSHVMTN